MQEGPINKVVKWTEKVENKLESRECASGERNEGKVRGLYPIESLFEGESTVNE
jgi:hypothetical protein